MKEYVFKPPFNRTLTINTCCVVGVCTCIMMKITVEKVFKNLGITDIDIQPALESNPLGDRSKAPDIIMMEPLRIEEIKERYPDVVFVVVEDLAKVDKIQEEVVKELTKAGWLEVIEK